MPTSLRFFIPAIEIISIFVANIPAIPVNPVINEYLITCLFLINEKSCFNILVGRPFNDFKYQIKQIKRERYELLVSLDYLPKNSKEYKQAVTKLNNIIKGE